jgi:hypothetical protein
MMFAFSSSVNRSSREIWLRKSCMRAAWFWVWSGSRAEQPFCSSRSERPGPRFAAPVQARGTMREIHPSPCNGRQTRTWRSVAVYDGSIFGLHIFHGFAPVALILHPLRGLFRSVVKIERRLASTTVALVFGQRCSQSPLFCCPYVSRGG